MPYVFYDTETTGTETAFDQILQFAAIRTDDDLNEVDRFDIRCRLLPPSGFLNHLFSCLAGPCSYGFLLLRVELRGVIKAGHVNTHFLARKFNAVFLKTFPYAG